MESKIIKTKNNQDKLSEKDEDSSSNSNSSNKNLVIRFVEYAFKVLNQNMDNFFEENLNLFDQDINDLNDGKGETIEQYLIYQKYLNELEIQFDKFAIKEGYESSTKCFEDINKLIIDDEIERKKLFQEMAEKMLQTFNNLQQQIENENDLKDEGKDSNDNDNNDNKDDEKKSDSKHNHNGQIKKTKQSKSDSKGNEEEEDNENDNKEGNDEEIIVEVKNTPAPPVIMFFQPVSLDSMLQHVLTLTEYTTFSYIIRTKLKQKQLYLSLQDRVSKQSKNNTKRQRLIERGEHFEDIYQELITRICDFTPHQTKFHEQIRAHLNISQWNELISARDEITPDLKLIFKRLTMNVCMSIWNYVSIDEQILVRQALSIFLPQIDQLETHSDVLRAAGNFLNLAHGLIDKTEAKMLHNLQVYYDKQHEIRNEKNESKHESKHESKSHK